MCWFAYKLIKGRVKFKKKNPKQQQQQQQQQPKKKKHLRIHIDTNLFR